MAKKKSGLAGKTPTPKPAQKTGSTTTWWIVAGVIVVIAVAGIVYSTRSGSATAAGGTVPGSTTAAADPAEAKYIGRLLPAGYSEAKLADTVPYTSSIPMTPVTAVQDASGVSFLAKAVTDSKNISFQYTAANGQSIPMIAYLKPSGKLFVGVSYCIPCKGTGQRLESDGTLTCETCGTKRDPESQAGISGACRRYPLDEVPAKLVGDKIVVDKTVLDNWTPQPQDRPVGA